MMSGELLTIVYRSMDMWYNKKISELCVAVLLIISIFDFYSVVEERYKIPFKGILYYIACEKSSNGKILGDTIVYNVLNDEEKAFLNKIAVSLDKDVTDFTGSEYGNIGYMQMLPSVFYRWQQDGDDDGIKDPTNPYDSIESAGFYISYLNAIHDGDVLKVLMSYYGVSDETLVSQVLLCLHGSPSCRHTLE